jgi:hypothetical protein
MDVIREVIRGYQRGTKEVIGCNQAQSDGRHQGQSEAIAELDTGRNQASSMVTHLEMDRLGNLG